MQGVLKISLSGAGTASRGQGSACASSPCPVKGFWCEEGPLWESNSIAGKLLVLRCGLRAGEETSPRYSPALCRTLKDGLFHWSKIYETEEMCCHSPIAVSKTSLMQIEISGAGPTQLCLAQAARIHLKIFHGFVILWFHDSMILWFHSSMIPWFHGSMISWFYCSIIPQFHGSMIPWLCSSVILWSYDI